MRRQILTSSERRIYRNRPKKHALRAIDPNSTECKIAYYGWAEGLDVVLIKSNYRMIKAGMASAVYGAIDGNRYGLVKKLLGERHKSTYLPYFQVISALRGNLRIMVLLQKHYNNNPKFYGGCYPKYFEFAAKGGHLRAMALSRRWDRIEGSSALEFAAKAGQIKALYLLWMWEKQIIWHDGIISALDNAITSVVNAKFSTPRDKIKQTRVRTFLSSWLHEKIINIRF